jgi:hypothetical protein
MKRHRERAEGEADRQQSARRPQRQRQQDEHEGRRQQRSADERDVGPGRQAGGEVVELVPRDEPRQHSRAGRDAPVPG